MIREYSTAFQKTVYILLLKTRESRFSDTGDKQTEWGEWRNVTYISMKCIAF